MSVTAPPRFALAVAALIGALFAAPRAARAFTLPEHSRIGMRAIRALRDRAPGSDGRAYGQLRALWSSLQADPDRRLELCRDIDEASRVTRSTPIDCVAFADLPALAADHSCSPEDLARILDSARRAAEAHPGADLTDQHWVFRVLRAGQEADELFTESGGVPGRIGSHGASSRRRAVADLNLQLSIDDPDYLRRAQVNLTHFQRARVATDFEAWLREAMATPNATSSYVIYHLLALHLAREYVEGCTKGVPCGDRASRAWRVFLTEAFALHFLEDSFASGHFQGASADSEVRNGRHDFACSHGAWAQPWEGPPRYFAYGDAFMQPTDEARAAAAVTASLAQLGEVLVDESVQTRDALLGISLAFAHVTSTGFAYDSCQADPSSGVPHDVDPRRVTAAALPPAAASPVERGASVWPLLADVLLRTPMPITDAQERGMPERVNARGVALAWGVNVNGYCNLTNRACGFQAMASFGAAVDADSILSPYRDGISAIHLVGGFDYGSDGAFAGLAGMRFRLPFTWGLPVIGWIAWGPTIASDGGDAPSWAWARAAAATRFPRPLIGNPFANSRHLLQLSLGREATVLARLAPDPAQQGVALQGVEVQVPVVSFAARRGEHYTRWPVEYLVADLGVRVGWVGPDRAPEFGLVLSLGPRFRYIFP